MEADGDDACACQLDQLPVLLPRLRLYLISPPLHLIPCAEVASPTSITLPAAQRRPHETPPFPEKHKMHAGTIYLVILFSFFEGVGANLFQVKWLSQRVEQLTLATTSWGTGSSPLVGLNNM